MSVLLQVLLVWLLVNLAITLYLYQGWYYERRCQTDYAHLDGCCERIAFGRAWLTIGREMLVFMFMQLCYPLSWWRDRHQPELPDGDDTPILLVHGFACNSSCLLWLKWRLEKNGHTRVRAVSYFPPTGNVHKLVPQIKRHIRQLLDDTGAERIHYIAHSMGGVLARDLLADPDFADCIDKVICLGSPHHGSRAANLIAPFVPGAVRQMQYQSDYVKNLAATPGQAHWFAINSQMDDLVLPVTSALVPGMTHLTVDYLGHCSLLYSPQVVTLIERCLSDNQSEA